MSGLVERMCVLYNNGKDRGIVLRIEGASCVLVCPDLQSRVALVGDCVPMPMTMCFLCGDSEDMTPEEQEAMIAKSDEIMKRDFGAAPPPERRMPLCTGCAARMYELDAETDRCSCAFSRGESTRCTCAWRRARGFQGAGP